MVDVLLTPPSSWADQLRSLPLDELILSYDPRTLNVPGGRSLRDVERDLAVGAWLARTRPARDEIFRLGGNEFELKVKRRPGMENHAWMAEVRHIYEASAVPRQGRVLPRRVVFEEVWKEAPCDLAAIEFELRRREKEVRQDRRHGAPVQVEVRAHGKLQADVRREYGELEALVGILEQRPQMPGETISGVVRPRRQHRGAQSSIVVAAGCGGIDVFRGKRVQLSWADSRSYNSRVTAVHGGLIEIAEPRDWVVEPGEEVSLSVVRPFGLWQDAEALAKFRAGDIEGSWDDLARLLCRPGELAPRAGLAPPSAYYCDDDPEVPVLNDEQRHAVAGAVGSPHAFFIQGPPGTGKTEVICEIVRQLVGRGERVLLLAPTHVAVDEVLRRAGHKPGVRPLRITWSDDLVDDHLRRFLPKNVGSELAGRVMRPTDHGQVARWERERHAVDQQLVLVAELGDVLRRHAAAFDGLQRAEAAAADAAERLRSRAVDADQELAARRAALADDEQVLAHAGLAAQAAAQGEEAERAELEPGLVMLRAATAGLTAAASTAVDAMTAETTAADTLRSWSSAYQVELKAATETRARAQQAVLEAHEHCARAVQWVGAVQEALDRAVAGQSGWDRFAERFRLGAVARERKALASAQDLVRQWQAELARREPSWSAATIAYDKLVRRGSARADELERRVAKARRAREEATEGRSEALQRVLEAVAVVGGEALDGTTGAECWEERGHLGLALHRALEATLDFRAGEAGTAIAGLGNVTGLGSVVDQLERLRRAKSERRHWERELSAAVRRRDERAAGLRESEASAGADLARLRAESGAAQAALADCRVELEAITTEREKLVGALGEDDPRAAEARLRRRRHVLGHLPALDAQWRELAAERTDEQLLEDIQSSVVRATNLVCATTKGIVGKGSELVRHADYDTLIVDEASRVTESEFLIGAVKARRWVLVGDERQLPPYVDQEDEHFLHALTALHRTDRGAAATVEQAVDDLAEQWGEDEKERAYRRESVLEVVRKLDSSGQWSATFRDQFHEAHQHFQRGKSQGADIDRRLLQAMLRYLVQSLFQRAVPECPPSLRQRLVWQRRMIAPLARIVNEPIYDRQYLSPPDAELTAAGVMPLVLPQTFVRPAVFLDTTYYRDAGETQVRHGFVNQREQDLVVRACEVYNAALRTPITVSVLAFYRAQARELERRLLALKLPMLQWEVIDVIDRIQGQQSDLVVLSFTRARRGGVGDNYGQWLQDVRRLNVACTRARRALVLVGHSGTLRRLRASEQARAFYANLLGLFDNDENFQWIAHLESSDSSGRRR